MKLVYATSNPGKFAEVHKLFRQLHIELHAPREYGIQIEVDENGKTLEENATKKAVAYSKVLPKDCAVIGDDTGVFIAALGGQPGIHVRRWNGAVMTDQEIIDYCLTEMKHVPVGEREAEFKTSIVVVAPGHPTLKFEGRLLGSIVEKPIENKIKGFPFESLFFAEEYSMMLGQIHELPVAKKIAKNILTHRERAIMLALPYLKGLLGIN